MIKGAIHSIETFGSVDGPGIRFIVFLKGCNLRCKYCHNADTWDPKSEDMRTPDELLDFAGIYVGVGVTTVAEHNLRALADERECGRNEGIGGNDDFVARAHTGQDCGHLQGICATSRQKALSEAEAFLEELLAPLREFSIAGYLAAFNRLTDIFRFLAGHIGLVKWYFHCLLPLPPD